MGKENVQIVIDAKDNASKRLGAVRNALGGIASIATGMIAANVLTGVARQMTSLGGAAISVESAMAGVTKTTDGLVDNMGNLTYIGEALKAGFREMAKEIPISVEELMHIGELGGQLGIAQDNLLDFTRTIADLGVTTNLSTEDAAMSLAQLMNVMGTNQKDIDKLGSVIVDLGNNFATTEADIVSFASRISGMGEIAGLSEADILAISAAFSSVGIEAEAGGTAVQKVLMAMNTAVASGSAGLWATTAGMTSMEFEALFGADPAKAFQAFVEGLGRAGDDAIGILEELELKDQRLIRSFLSLSKAGDLLGDSIDRGTEAWGENNALSKEGEQRLPHHAGTISDYEKIGYEI